MSQQPVTYQPQVGYAQPGQPVHYQQGGQYGAPPGQPGYYGQPQGAPPPQGFGQPAPPGYAQPMMQQGAPAGQGAGWMQKPVVAGCPPGLEYLTSIDQLLVHQQVELLEAFTGWETNNKYQIKNSMGQQVYFAAEETDMCMRQCCGPQRSFTMHITDNMNQEVIRVSREFKCCAGCNCCACWDCCAMEVTVEAPVGQVVGYVKQLQSCLAPKYKIMDSQQQTVLTCEGPVCICQGPCCTWDQEFHVRSADGATDVGKISKQWTGLVKEYFTDADNFGVSFPMDLDVKIKATMLGAVFLIDFMFFEQKQNNNN